MSTAPRARIVEERVSAIRGLLRERGANAAMLRARRNFAWATFGGESHVLQSTEQGVAALLVTPTDALVFTSVIEAPRIHDEELSDLPLEIRAFPWHDEAAMEAAVERIAGGRVLDDAALEADLVGWRSVLADPDAERLTWLAGRAASVLPAALATVVRGMTEHEVASVVTGRMVAEGIRTPVLLVAADDRIDHYRHPLPTTRRVEHRVMVGLVIERWGLHAAISRFAELMPPGPALQRRLDAVDRVHAAMAAATRTGATLGDVVAAGTAAYAETGFPEEWTLHHQGGIIGYQARERIAVPGDPTVIRPGMAFAWNPSIAGSKAEETLLVGSQGTRALTATR